MLYPAEHEHVRTRVCRREVTSEGAGEYLTVKARNKAPGGNDSSRPKPGRY